MTWEKQWTERISNSWLSHRSIPGVLLGLIMNSFGYGFFFYKSMTTPTLPLPTFDLD